MADQLATPADLAAVLQLSTTLDSTLAAVLLETATAVVQEAAGNQRILQVAGDVLAIEGTTDSWLALPQLPVTSVASVVLDGVTLSTAANDYKVIGSRLWRAASSLPSSMSISERTNLVELMLTHGSRSARSRAGSCS